MKSRNYRAYRITVIVITFLTVVITLYADKGNGYDLMPLIPGVFLVLYAASNKIHIYSESHEGMLILNIIMFLKYVLTYLFVAICNSYIPPRYFVNTVQSGSFRQGTILIIAEMVSIFAVIELFSDSIYRNQKNENCQSRYSAIQISPLYWLVIFLMGTLVVVRFTDYISNAMILFSEGNILTDTANRSNIFSTIFQAFNTVIFCFIINHCIVKYENTKLKKYVIFAYIAAGLLTLLSVSTSRLNVIIPILIFIYLTWQIFGRLGFLLDCILFIGLITIFTVITAYRSPWNYSGNYDMNRSLYGITETMQQYTSGILPNAMGLQAIAYYKNSISITTLFNDIFGSMPFVSNFINQSNRLNWIYNQYALAGSSTSQLVPLTVTSYAYFGPIFCFFLSDLCVIALMYSDKNFQIRFDNFAYDYLMIYLDFIFAAGILSTLQSTSGRFFVRFLPAYLLLVMNRILKVR